MAGRSPIRLSPIGHSPMAKIRRCIGESTVDFRQLAKVRWTLPVVTKQYQYRIYVRAHVNVIGIGIS
jgi:hypothetical protein